MYKKYNKYTQAGHDYEEGINWDRLRRERLNNVTTSMKKHGFGALVVFMEENIRYTSAVTGLPFVGSRYLVISADGKMKLFEQGGDLRWVKDFGPTWLKGNVTYGIPLGDAGQFKLEARPKLYALWMEGVKKALTEMGVMHEKIGFDWMAGLEGVLKEAGIKYAPCWDCMYDARKIKTWDERQLIAISQTIASAGFKTMEQMIQVPGIRETQVWAEMNKTMLSLGAESVVGTFCSGGRTNPYYRTWATDRIMGPGDLVICDIVMRYMGYGTCVVRTMLVGDDATSEQKALYREAYDAMYRTMNACKAGVTTDKVAAALPVGTFEDYSLNIVHGLGISGHEPPAITHMTDKEHPQELKEHMYLAIETYSYEPGCNDGVRLEEDIIVTEEGYDLMSRYPFEKKLM